MGTPSRECSPWDPLPGTLCRGLQPGAPTKGHYGTPSREPDPRESPLAPRREHPPRDPLQRTASRGPLHGTPCRGTVPGDPVHGAPQGTASRSPSSGSPPWNPIQGTAQEDPHQGNRSRRPPRDDPIHGTPSLGPTLGAPSSLLDCYWCTCRKVASLGMRGLCRINRDFLTFSTHPNSWFSEDHRVLRVAYYTVQVI
jgi:hypothetical protein